MILSLCRDRQSRTIDRTVWLLAAGISAWLGSTSTANAQEIQTRFLVTSSEVVRVMESRQLPTRGVQVRLAAPITARIANPPLEIEAAAVLSSHEVRLRIACRDRSQCLSFFVTATYPEEMSPGSFPMKLEHPQATVKQSAASIAALATTSVPVAPADSGKPPIMHSGLPATLDLDGDRVHVRVEVICLETGAAGDKIRVTTRDHKQIYIAEIVTSSLLKGTLTR